MEFSDDPHPDSPVEWADNRVSNAFAALSTRFTPSWCQTPEHWTSRLTHYLYTDCPCCILFRGIVVGMALGVAIGFLMASVMMLLLAANWK